ncbi:Major Facilitator Superfamily protein [Streptomyces sp. 1222.2]|uniref:MFS transporter n=1 Tax=Streptomyces sp. 1222.2 TaxID=1938833 RepID=UPI000BDD6A73|nr:MFS transporter [Streptomyces sp. 1222.2]SOD65171.1 Major Facilitator Superfamily protein [Streptomyces sp. 1222.2]SOE08282.1 Major Facilitator Superfamily protein [Streptomyces sp. 1222.2]
MTTTEQEPRTGRTVLPTASRWLTLLLVVFAVLVMSRSMSEGIYDIAFANLALDLSGLVSTVGLVYCVGYGVEVVASIAAGPLLDRGNPKTVLVVAYLVKIGVFVFIGIGSTFLSSHLWAIVVAAATVDLVHHIGEMALFVLLPRILDAKTLVRVQGIGGTIRSAAELLSPVVAGLVIALLPGSRALLVAAGLQVLALAVFAGFIAVVARQPGSAHPKSVHAQDSGATTGVKTAGTIPEEEPAPAPLPSRRAVARTLASSPAWRRFLTFHALTVLALSTVILSLLSLMRETFDMSPARAGFFLAFSTIGAIIGGLVVAKAGPEGIYSSLRWATALAGAGTLTAALLGGTQWILAAALVLFGLGFTVYLRSAGLLVQLRAPAALLGTWHGLLDAVIRIVSAGAILATGFLFDRFGGRPVYLVFGALLLLTAALWSTFGTQDRQNLGSTPLHPAPTPAP